MKKIEQIISRFIAENWLAVTIIALAIVVGTFVYFDEQATLQSLTPEHRAQVDKYREIVRTANIGEFVTFVPRDYVSNLDRELNKQQQQVETWVVVEHMFNPDRIKVQGPGPDSKPDQRTMILSSELLAALSFFEGKATGYPVRHVSTLRKTDMGFLEYGRFHFLQ